MSQLDIIKLYVLIVSLGIASLGFANKQESSLRKSVTVDWLTLSDSTQKRIVRDYVNALDSFALAMPILGSDTESTWAADTVHMMTQRVREEQRSFLENMADVYKIHSYIAYGMSYFNAIIGLPHDTTKLKSHGDGSPDPLFKQ